MMLWSQDAVKAAVIEAFSIDQLIGGRIGPKQYGSNMPDYFRDEQEIKTLELLERLSPEKGGSDGAEWRRLQNERRSMMEKARRITPREVSRMEMILLGNDSSPSWLYHMLQQEGQPRQELEAYTVQSARCSLRGREFKENKFCKRMSWSYSGYRSRRDRAAGIIAFRLNDRGIGCWVEGKGTPDTDPRDVPLTYVLMEFLKSGPKSKFQFVAFCHNHRVIPAKDVNNNAVAQAIGTLIAQGRIRRLADGRLEKLR